MPAITIKNLPEELHGALKARAQEHGRSLNGEVLACLKAAVSVSRLELVETLAGVDRVRRADGVRLDPALLDAALKVGRP
jgi:plasmid stability protein